MYTTWPLVLLGIFFFFLSGQLKPADSAKDSSEEMRETRAREIENRRKMASAMEDMRKAFDPFGFFTGLSPQSQKGQRSDKKATDASRMKKKKKDESEDADDSDSNSDRKRKNKNNRMSKRKNKKNDSDDDEDASGELQRKRNRKNNRMSRRKNIKNDNDDVDASEERTTKKPPKKTSKNRKVPSEEQEDDASNEATTSASASKKKGKIVDQKNERSTEKTSTASP